MKDSSTSCMVVAALIASVMFAAALIVPGGYTNDTGIPIFKQSHAFMIFIVSDALSLFSSSASLMIFLHNFMSCYAEEDFLKTLPQKMMLGLGMLTFSIMAMTVAFCVALDILLYGRPSEVTIPILSLATLATRKGKPHRTRITGVDDPESIQRVVGGLKIIEQRLEKLAEAVGMPF
ncbi:hypothetical protein HHK36_030474 [Tetracentron sinense]|uniref:PGG domain-containing protein n=1 Tax=Tetracentron sinense TaxID=13715 RepID=A0A834YC67_TETSI|nr:hypothetical protein HHK36_030474 [Tetracentron sinense]